MDAILEDVQIDVVLSYFESTWVSGSTIAGRSRGNAPFPPVLWNVRGRTLERKNRTNNPVESFHSLLKTFVRLHRPSIWAFIKALLNMQSDTDGKITPQSLGKEPPKRKTKDKARDNMICNATTEYGNRDLISYLDLVMNL